MPIDLEIIRPHFDVAYQRLDPVTARYELTFLTTTAANVGHTICNCHGE